MVIDSSALIAILASESDAPAIVAYGKDTSSGLERLDGLAGALRLEIVPFRADHMRLAIDARQRYARGTKHPARLNLGGCFVYALAKAMGLPLLFKGDDFRHTDIIPALPQGGAGP